MKDINSKYQELCTILGDIDVKIQGLKNQREELYKQLAELDIKAKARITELEVQQASRERDRAAYQEEKDEVK